MRPMKTFHLFAAVLMLLLLGLWKIDYVNLGEILSSLSAPKMHSSIRIVNTNADDGTTKPPFPCIPVQISDLQYPMCTYLPAEDRPVSGVYHRKKYFEASHVTFIMERMKKDERLQFVDFGANIGTYTLAMAHMGRTVLAVEPNAQTSRRLRTSLRLGNVSDRVTLLLNAVSNVHTTLRLGTDLKNRGDTFMLKANNCTGVDLSRCVENSVDTITMDDLLPLMRSHRAIIKADVQGSEMDIFDPATSLKFFEKVHVPVIYLEWEFFKPQYADVEKRKKIDDWLENYFFKLNYTVYHGSSAVKLSLAWQNWPWTVLFMKQ